jgi:hypothetical protein
MASSVSSIARFAKRNARSFDPRGTGGPLLNLTEQVEEWDAGTGPGTHFAAYTMSWNGPYSMQDDHPNVFERTDTTIKYFRSVSPSALLATAAHAATTDAAVLCSFNIYKFFSTDLRCGSLLLPARAATAKHRRQCTSSVLVLCAVLLQRCRSSSGRS